MIANLANALQHTGRRSDLLEAEKYLREARKLFGGVRKGGVERAKLDWITGMIRYQLKQGQPCILKEIMDRAFEDFMAKGMTLEALAVASDLMKMKLARRRWGAGSARDLVREILKDLKRDRRLLGISADVRAALERVGVAVNACGFNAKDALKTAVDDLRKACGPGSSEGLACLVTWEQEA